MTNSTDIYDLADRLVHRFGTRNPDRIASELGIKVYDNMNTKSLLGMYYYNWKTRMVFLNASLDPRMRLEVLAHEIGHDQQHRDIAKNGGLQEFTLFSNCSEPLGSM